MAETKPLPDPSRDACPQCGGHFLERRAATREEYDDAMRPEGGRQLPPGVDSAHPRFVQEHGTLFVCALCRYATRYKFPAVVAPDPAPPLPALPAAGVAALPAAGAAQIGTVQGTGTADALVGAVVADRTAV